MPHKGLAVLQYPHQDVRNVIRVLFVEDNPVDFHLFHRALSKKPYTDKYQIECVDTYEGALDVLREQRHDIVFVDYSLDENNGVMLIQILKDEGHQGPFVILTSTDDENLVSQSLQQGVYDYLLKGEITPSLLDRTIRYTLESKKNEEQLQADRHRHKLGALGQMAGGMAHELNNLLQPIMMKAENIYDDTDDGAVQIEAIKIIECAKKAASIISDVLSFSHLDHTEIKAQNLQCEIIKHINFAREMLPKSVELETTGFDSQLEYLAEIDSSDLFRIFTNLFSNAAYAMEYRGRISVRFSVLHLSEGERKRFHLKPRILGDGINFIKIIVEDSGPGIDLAEIDKIFTPFYTTKDTGEGTGLGLSIVYGILESWGGTIYAEKKAKGACFVMLIPLIRAQAG